jgi:hypothetical protein
MAQATAPVHDSTEADEGQWTEGIAKKGNTGDILRLSSLKGGRSMRHDDGSLFK